MESKAVTRCCRLCSYIKIEYININENSASGLNVAQTVNKYIHVEVTKLEMFACPFN